MATNERRDPNMTESNLSEPRREAERAVGPLLTEPEDELFAELGIRARALSRHPAAAGSFNPDVRYNEVWMGDVDDVRAFGRRLYDRWDRELHDLVCGNDPGGQAQRKALGDELGAGEPAFAAYLALLVVSSLGIAPALASVAAVIVVKRSFDPTLDHLCETWAASLA
jgi:hypothetical protein